MVEELRHGEMHPRGPTPWWRTWTLVEELRHGGGPGLVEVLDPAELRPGGGPGPWWRSCALVEELHPAELHPGGGPGPG